MKYRRNIIGVNIKGAISEILHEISKGAKRNMQRGKRQKEEHIIERKVIRRAEEQREVTGAKTQEPYRRN